MPQQFDVVHERGSVRCDQGSHGGAVRAVVVHETQGTSYSGGRSTLQTRPDGSAHLLAGWDNGKLRIGRLAGDDRILCHTGGQNTGSIGVEKCGLSSWKIPFRLGIKNERILIAATAWLTAHELRKHGLPPRYLSIKRLKRTNDLNDNKGWTYHRNCAYAFRTTTHTDPGIPGVTWPHKRFKTYLEFYYHHPKRDEMVPWKEVRKWARRSKRRH